MKRRLSQTGQKDALYSRIRAWVSFAPREGLQRCSRIPSLFQLPVQRGGLVPERARVASATHSRNGRSRYPSKRQHQVQCVIQIDAYCKGALEMFHFCRGVGGSRGPDAPVCFQPERCGACSENESRRAEMQINSREGATK